MPACAENIIPEELTMAGTIRTLDSAMQKDVHEKIRRTAEKIAESIGATAEVTIDNKTPVTYNDPALGQKNVPSLEKAAEMRTWKTNGLTGAEDFSFYGAKAPAFFFFVGGMPKGKDPKQTAAASHPGLLYRRQPAGCRGQGVLQYRVRFCEVSECGRVSSPTAREGASLNGNTCALANARATDTILNNITGQYKRRFGSEIEH